jgi:hypothetical protein
MTPTTWHRHASDALLRERLGAPIDWNPDQAWYWTKEWQDGERESLEAYARGDYFEFATVDDVIAWLRRDDD